MVLTSIVEFAVVLSTFVVKLMAPITDEVVFIILTGVVLTPIVEFVELIILTLLLNIASF